MSSQSEQERNWLTSLYFRVNWNDLSWRTSIDYSTTIKSFIGNFFSWNLTINHFFFNLWSNINEVWVSVVKNQDFNARRRFCLSPSPVPLISLVSKRIKSNFSLFFFKCLNSSLDFTNLLQRIEIFFSIKIWQKYWPFQNLTRNYFLISFQIWSSQG